MKKRVINKDELKDEIRKILDIDEKTFELFSTLKQLDDKRLNVEKLNEKEEKEYISIVEELKLFDFDSLVDDLSEEYLEKGIECIGFLLTNFIGHDYCPKEEKKKAICFFITILKNELDKLRKEDEE